MMKFKRWKKILVMLMIATMFLQSVVVYADETVPSNSNPVETQSNNEKSDYEEGIVNEEKVIDEVTYLDEKTDEELPETDLVNEEIPAEVKAFLDAVDKLPDSIETGEDYDAVETAMQQILGMYQSLSEENQNLDEVNAVLPKLGMLQEQLGKGRPEPAAFVSVTVYMVYPDGTKTNMGTASSIISGNQYTIEAVLKAANSSYFKYNWENTATESDFYKIKSYSGGNASGTSTSKKISYTSNGELNINLDYNKTSVPLTLIISAVPAFSGFTMTKYIPVKNVGSMNSSGTAYAYFTGDNTNGWTLNVKVEIGNYTETFTTTKKVTNYDMSGATGDVDFGVAWRATKGLSTNIVISGGKATYNYYLNYDGNKPSGATENVANVPSQQKSEKSTATTWSPVVSSTVPTLTGYTFGGWYLNSSGTGTMYVGGNKVSGYSTTKTSQTLYAKWTENKYTIIWEDGYTDDTLKTVEDVSYTNVTSTINSEKPENPTREGYEFTGWGTPVYDHTNKTVTVTAQWEEDNNVSKPDAPTHEEVSKLIGDVTVKCEPEKHDNVTVGHEGEECDCDRISIGGVEGNDNDGYTCAVTFLAEKYEAAYNDEIDEKHTLVDNEVDKTVTFKFDNDSGEWELADGQPTSVEFLVECAAKTTYTVVHEYYKLGEGQWGSTRMEIDGKVIVVHKEGEDRHNPIPGKVGDVIGEDDIDKVYNYGEDGDFYDYISVSPALPYTLVKDPEKNIIYRKYLQMADLSITKSVDKASVKVGGALTYTITVMNNGTGAATNVTVSDTLPVELDAGSMTSTPSDRTSSTVGGITTYTWNLGTIEAGNTAIVEFTVKTKAAGKIENSASVKCDEVADPVPTDPEKPAKTTIYDLKVTKGNNGFNVDQETGIATVRYTVNVTNNSGFSLYGLDIIDTLDTVVTDTSNDPVDTVNMTLKPVSLEVDGKDTGTLGNESKPRANRIDQVRTWEAVLDRNEEFKTGSTVTLVYDIEIENKGTTGVNVKLNNKAKGGSWTTEKSASSTVMKTLLRMIMMTSRNTADPYDAEDEDESNASINTSSSGGYIPATKKFNLIYDLNGGNGGPKDQNATVTTEGVISYTFNVAGAEASIAIPTNGSKVFKGWSDTQDGDVAYAYDSTNGIYTPGTVKVELETGKTAATRTLYAVWEDVPRTITIKYWAEGADKENDQPLKTETITVIEDEPIVDGDKYKESELVDVNDFTDEDGNHYIVETIPSGEEKTVAGDGEIEVICTLDNKTDEKHDGNGDEQGDGIPDKYQVEVTFSAVNGTLEGPTSVVVTLTDKNGKYATAEDGGKAALEADQIPTATANDGYGNGIWTTPGDPNEYEIRENTDFVITFTQNTTPGTEPEDPEPTEPENPDPTPAPGPTPTPGPGTDPTPTVIVPEAVPAAGPTPIVTPVALTPAAATPAPAAATPVAEAEGPAIEAIADEAVPLAAGEGEEAPEFAALDDEEVPLAPGKGASWALINFALMNLAIFESLMLLIGYFVKTKNDKDEEEEKRKLKKKGLFRILSLPVAVISLIAFILTEDITLPTAFVDKYTIVMLIIAVVQTVVVALSNKKYEDEEEQNA